jgi:hypothetical protein
MIVYKFKSLIEPNREEAIKRICQIAIDRKMWCSAPVRLNDPDEFKTKYVFTRSEQELKYLGLIHARAMGTNKPTPVAVLKKRYHSAADIKKLAGTIFTEMIDDCRKDLGLFCMSRTANEPELWERYADNGNGVCISIEIPDNLIGKEYWKVDYVSQKKLPLVIFLKAALYREYRKEAYYSILLTKTKQWEKESELRYVAINQNVLVPMNCSIKQVIFGSQVNNRDRADLTNLIKNQAPDVSVAESTEIPMKFLFDNFEIITDAPIIY